MITLSSAVDAFTRWDPSPHVGDLLNFPAEGVQYPLAPSFVAHTNEGRSCRVDLSMLHQMGGSFAVVSRHADNDQFVVHWAGRHTSDGDSDCGPNADLTLTRADIQTLAAHDENP